jgi:hypothetical protein
MGGEREQAQDTCNENGSREWADAGCREKMYVMGGRDAGHDRGRGVGDAGHRQ